MVHTYWLYYGERIVDCTRMDGTPSAREVQLHVANQHDRCPLSLDGCTPFDKLRMILNSKVVKDARPDEVIS